MKTFTILTVFVFLFQGGFSQAVGTTYQPVVSQNEYFDISVPLTEIGPIAPRGASGHHQHKGHPGIPERQHETVYKNLEHALPKGDDPVWQKEMGSRFVDPPFVNFQGVRNDDNGGYYDLIAPPDTDGDVSPTHYFQMCNTIFEIFDKNGNSLFGPADNSTIWDGFVGDWTGTNDGDPIVLYDEQADRWLVSQFAIDTDITGGTYWVLVAISTTSNPMGSYYRYAFQFTDYPDYPKFGVWRDGYYLMVQHGNGTATAAALNRSQMIAGNSTAQMVSYNIPGLPGSGFSSVLPADNDGDWAPSGSPNYFVYFSDDAWDDDPNDCLKIWEFDVYWPIPVFSSLTLTQSLNTASFNSAFGSHNQGIIPQPGTTQKLAVMEKALMHRLQYRNFGTYQSMVCCHTVDVNGSNRAGVRWYELRKTTGNWSIHQQGTYAPGTTDNYWMASIAQNGNGDIALGYSIASSSTYPSIRYTGRKAGDPLGLMTLGEGVIFNGDDSQEGTARWGDYTMMSVDPSDDVTFWYTNEYNDDFTTWGNWITQVAAFEFNDYCTAGASSTAYEYIANVNIGSIDNSTGSSGYANYTNLSTNIPLNGSGQVTVTNGNAYSSNQCGIWVDWNRDEDFNDAGETITVSGTPGTGPYTATIAPPAGVTTGECVMRIRITYNTAPDPCGFINFGEVEDYTINVTNAVANVWTGAYNHYWHQANNWSLGRIPTSVDPVEIPNVGYQPVYVDDYPSVPNESCKTLNLGAGATLQMRNQILVVYGDALIYGNVVMNEADAILTIEGDITWFSGSALDANDNSTFINVYGIWEARNGSDLDPDMGFVDFLGNSSAYIRSYDPDNKFYNLRIYKYDGAELGLSSYSTEPLRVKNLIFVNSGALFNNYDEEDIILEGAFNCYGTFDMTLNSNSSNFIFDGSNSGYNNYSSGSGTFNNVVFSASNQAMAYSDFQVAKNLTIEQGIFNPNGHTITVSGNWTNSIGPDAFAETDSRVIFNGTGHQYVYGDEHFNILEVNNGAALRLNNSSFDVSCNVYDWTAGGIDIVAGNFTALDLADNGLYGTYWCNPNGTLTLTQDGSQYTDLNGEIHIFGGTMTVNGGLGSSYWPYVDDALISMSDGVLDFTNAGVYFYGASTYSLTTNITGGTIRTSGSFYGTSDEFTPAGGTVEVYGNADAQVGFDGTSHFYGLRIDKTAKNAQGYTPANTTSYAQADPDRPPEPVIDGSRANTASAFSNFSVVNNLTIESGTFDIGEYQVTVDGDVDIYGTLAMTDPAGDLTADFIEWHAGSEDNVTAGTFHALTWRFNEGTNAMLGVGNTAYLNDLYFPTDDNAEFGNLVALPLSKLLTYPDSRAYYPTRVSGDFTIQSGANWTFSQPDAGMIVNGNATIEDGAYLGFSQNEFVVDGNITIAGTLHVSYEVVAIAHGEISWPETGQVYINHNGQVIFDAPNHPDKGWEYINGHLTLTEGLFEITNNSVNFGATASTDVSGGTIKTGGAFYAADPGVFEPTGGTVEVIGDTPDVNIYCYGGNFFYNFVLNRAPGTYSDLESIQAVEVKNDLTILSGILDTESSDLFIGGNWTNNVGPDGFVENENVVWFYGETYSNILTDETFYDLYIFDYLTDGTPAAGSRIVDETYIADGVTVHALHDCRILGGSLNLGSNSVLEVDSSLVISQGAQLIVPSATVAEIFVRGNLEDLNSIQGFFPGYSTFTFDGLIDQELNSAAPTEKFYNLVIDNEATQVMNTTTIECFGDLQVLNGNWVDDNTTRNHYYHGDVTIEPDGAFLPRGMVYFVGNQNTIFRNDATGSSYIRNTTFLNKSSSTASLTLESPMHILNDKDLILDRGTLNMNGNYIRCTNNVTITDNATLIVDAGASLEVGFDNQLSVQSGGTLEVMGTQADPAEITVWNAPAYYTFVVNTGGTIRAEHAVFEYMKGPDGVNVMNGATVDAMHSFNHCTFRNGDGTAGSVLLSINNNQDLTITGAVFPEATTAYNVAKDLNMGHLMFMDYSGAFSGEDFDYDPNNLIDWYEATLNVTPAIRNVDAPAGSTTFSVTSNLDWTVSESVPWFSVNPMSGSDNGTLTVNYTQNTTVNSRTGEITVSAEGVPDVLVSVVQAGVAPSLAVTPANRDVGPDAGNTTFSVTSNTSWAVSESSPWLSAIPATGSGNGTITAYFNQNMSGAVRMSEIHVTASGGTPALTVTVTQAPYGTHSIGLIAGWQGLSSHIMPVENSMEDVFNPVVSDLILAATYTGGIYYPAGPVNTIGTWNSQSAYKLKMSGSSTLPVMGEDEPNKNFTLSDGWNMVPVICNVPVDPVALFAGTNLDILKDVAGLGVYWPDMGINTLGNLEPGNAYLARLGIPGSIIFPPNADESVTVQKRKPAFPAHPWNDIVVSPASHVIGIVLANQLLKPGDVIGVFDGDLCCGVIQAGDAEQYIVLSAFADDPATDNKTGFENGEPMHFKVIQRESGEIMSMEPEFDGSRPNMHIFAEEGISVITDFKLSALGINQMIATTVSIFPNPTDGSVKISGIRSFGKIEIYSSAGKVMKSIETNHTRAVDLDLSFLSPGLYQIKLSSHQQVVVKKLIIR